MHNYARTLIEIHTQRHTHTHSYIDTHTHTHTHTHTPLDKNITPTSKMKKKIFTIFEIMKIRYMKDKVKRHSNFE